MKPFIISLTILALLCAGCESTPEVNSIIETPTIKIEDSDVINNSVEIEKSKPANKPEKEDNAPPKDIPKAKATTPKSNCDPNYSGCVPIASDVDCAEGSGNGPAYTGQVNVIGSDIYDLDSDNDGIACE